MILGKKLQMTLCVPCIYLSKSPTISELNALLCFTQHFKMAAKNGGKASLGKNCQMTLQIPWDRGSKISLKSLYLALFPRQMRFYILSRIYKIAAINGGKKNFRQKGADDSAGILGVKILSNSLYLTLFPTKIPFCHLMQKFKMAVNNGGKPVFFSKSAIYLFVYPVGK